MDSEKMKVLKEALLAGSVHIKNLFGKSVKEIGTEYKIKDGDTPRTLIDTHSESAILEVIRESGLFRDYSINAEESGQSGRGKNVLYIDPYDGTSNALIKLPMSTMGAGVFENGELVACAILNPFEEKLFYAQRGKGAFVENLLENCREPRRLNTDIATNSAKERFAWVDAFLNNNTTPRKLEWVRKMQESGLIQNIRMTGSNIDYSAKIAEGRAHYQLTDAIGGYFDLCGYNLIEEAGGRMVNLDGNQPTPKDHVAIAVANPKDLERVLEITRKCYTGYEGFR